MTDDEIVRAIKDLVAAGEHLDEIPGVRGARLSGGGVFSAERRFGVFRTERRIYFRGSPEHVEARAAGLVEPLPPPPPPAVPQALEEAERIVGHPFPRLVRRLYLEVGNGGFGPGYGILGVAGGHRDDLGSTVTEAYRRWHLWRADSTHVLPDGLVPLAHWGCGIYSFVDCTDPNDAMWACDPNPGIEEDVFPQPLTLSEWLERWVDGRLYQPGLVEDPETGEWRPATDEDWADEDWAQ